ncbi:phage tail fiber protein [Thermodesulfobacteriota bacterium]
MANSYVQYLGDGARTQFDVTFPYLDKEDVHVYVDGIGRGYTWVTDTKIEVVNAAPIVDAVVTLDRQTGRTTSKVTFTSTNMLDEESLNRASLQAFYLAQEAFDYIVKGDTGDIIIPDFQYDADVILGLLEGGITENHLYSVLANDISQIGDLVVDVNSLFSQTTTLDSQMISVQGDITTLQTDVDSFATAYTIKMSTEGFVAGMGLFMDSEGDSEFMILANKFMVVNDTIAAEAYNPSTIYYVGDYCIWTDKRRYICIDGLGIVGTDPTYDTYWAVDEPAIPFVVANGAVGINGNLLVTGSVQIGHLDGGIDLAALDPTADGYLDTVIAWGHENDGTLIDGGNIYTGTVTATEIAAGTITAAQIATNALTAEELSLSLELSIDADGYMTIGNVAAGDYMHLSEGDLKFYVWNGTNHELRQSIKGVIQGSADSGDTVAIPGVFPNAPKIALSPFNLRSYHADYPNQSQSFLLEATDLTDTGGGHWTFIPIAQLVLADGSISNGSGPSDSGTARATYSTSTQELSNNATQLDLTVNHVATFLYNEQDFQGYYVQKHYDIKHRITLWYKVDGVWLSEYQDFWTEPDVVNVANFSVSDPLPITEFYIQRTYLDDDWVSGGVYLGYDPPFPPEVNTSSVEVTQYTEHLSSAAVLAPGTISWTAIG